MYLWNLSIEVQQLSCHNPLSWIQCSLKMLGYG